MQGQIDGAISTWFYNYEPNTPNTLPTKDWTTDTIKDQHLGDLFYIVDNDEKAGQCYRYAKVDNVYKWIIVEDVEVAKAIADAATAQATVNFPSSFTNPFPRYFESCKNVSMSTGISS